jgi:hypothetical protein
MGDVVNTFLHKVVKRVANETGTENPHIHMFRSDLVHAGTLVDRVVRHADATNLRLFSHFVPQPGLGDQNWTPS